VIPIKLFAEKAFKMMDKVEKGKKLEENEIIRILQNYCFYSGWGIFPYSEEGKDWDSLYPSDKKVRKFCKKVLMKNYELLFDEHICEQSKINGLIEILDFAIRENSEELIKKIIEKSKNHPWTEKFVEVINEYALALTGSPKPETKAGKLAAETEIDKQKYKTALTNIIRQLLHEEKDW